MICTDNIFRIESESDFKGVALAIFRYQANNCIPYKRYLELINIESNNIDSVEKIPFLPIELFKSHKIYCGSDDPSLIFRSSGTTGMQRSTHFIKDPLLYETSFTRCFSLFYDSPSQCNIYALLPSYLENKESSLIYMVDRLIKESYDGGYFLYNHNELIEKLEHRDKSKKTILFGVSFALLDMAERYQIDLSQGVTVMETGGMKGKREEISREVLHKALCDSFGIDTIHSEYGMCECLSQSYSDGDGIFHSPSWMRILTRDIHDPFKILNTGVRGGINIIDLANIHSCSFIQTQDIGTRANDGSFTVEGRITDSDIRGCNMLIL